MNFWEALADFDTKKDLEMGGYENRHVTLPIPGTPELKITKRKTEDFVTKKPVIEYFYSNSRARELKCGTAIKGLRVLWNKSKKDYRQFNTWLGMICADESWRKYKKNYIKETLFEIAEKKDFTPVYEEQGFADDIYASALFPVEKM